MGMVYLKLALDNNPPGLELSVETQAGTCRPGEESDAPWVRDRRVTVSAESEDRISGVTGFFWTIHDRGREERPNIMNGGWKEEPSWTVSIPRDGVWEIAVAAQDGAGNLSETRRVVVRVDAVTAPTSPRSVGLPPARFSGARAWKTTRSSRGRFATQWAR